MITIKELYLANNKFTKIAKSAFVNLKNLLYLDLSFNLFKKLSPQMFSSAKKLNTLYVDRFGGYTAVSQLCPQLVELHLTSALWNCSYVKSLVGILNAQKIYLDFNEDRAVVKFACPKLPAILNKL